MRFIVEKKYSTLRITSNKNVTARCSMVVPLDTPKFNQGSKQSTMGGSTGIRASVRLFENDGLYSVLHIFPDTERFLFEYAKRTAQTLFKFSKEQLFYGVLSWASVHDTRI